MFGTYFVMLKSAIEYLVRGQRLPSWDLKMQVLCDCIRHTSMETYTLETTDEDIPSLDFRKIQERMRARDIPPSTVPQELGASKQHIFRVEKIPLTSEDIRGIGGVTEEPLLMLISQDNPKRTLDYEVLATWDTCNQHQMDTERALEPLPLSDDEKIMLCLHGGAYTMGSSQSHRSTLIRVCETTHLRAFILNYRLSPQHPFPSQLHDALLFHTFLVSQGFQPENIILVGDSAGGHLAIDLILLLRHMQILLPKALVLISPLVGLDLRGDSLQKNTPFDYLYPYPMESPTSPMRLFYKPGQRYSDEYIREINEDPILSPSNASLKGFPPTLIQSGAKEVLIDHICLFYEKLVQDNKESKNLMVNQIYDDMVHVFHRFFFRPESKQAFDAIAEFIENKN